jgi:hypothetical protein
MKLNLKLLNFNDTFGPRWDKRLGRAAQVRIVQMVFAVATDPPPEGWPTEPEVVFNVATQDPNLLDGIDFSNPDQVYTLDLEPAPPARKAGAKAANPEAYEPPAKEKPAHGKETRRGF